MVALDSGQDGRGCRGEGGCLAWVIIIAVGMASGVRGIVPCGSARSASASSSLCIVQRERKRGARRRTAPLKLSTRQRTVGAVRAVGRLSPGWSLSRRKNKT